MRHYAFRQNSYAANLHAALHHPTFWNSDFVSDIPFLPAGFDPYNLRLLVFYANCTAITDHTKENRKMALNMTFKRYDNNYYGFTCNVNTYNT
jgi:hypothetical protein